MVSIDIYTSRPFGCRAGICTDSIIKTEQQHKKVGNKKGEKMTVFKGVLQHIAGGQEYGKVGKFIRREFIDIGDQHIRGVQTTPYQDELLLSLMGKEITISGVGGKKGFTVVAIKTPDGEVHKGGIVGLILTTFLATIVGPIMG